MSIMIKNLDDPQIAELLLSGNICVMPSDTVYGLMCRAQDQQAVAKLYALKDRNAKPGTIIAGNKQQLIDLGIKPRYLTAVESFWPRAISVVIPCGPELEYLHLGKHSLALRVIAQPQLLAITEITGPLLTSSANLPGQNEVTTIQAAKQIFSEKVDFYVDGGEIKDHLPSTVIRIVDDAIEILREGAVKMNEKGEILS